jgi:hypothetical protein
LCMSRAIVLILRCCDKINKRQPIKLEPYECRTARADINDKRR